MIELRIYLYTCGVLKRIMADLKGYADFYEFVTAVSRRMKLYPSIFGDRAQYIITAHRTTTLGDSQIFAFAKWNNKENKLETTKV